jgi:hypothetical protein
MRYLITECLMSLRPFWEQFLASSFDIMSKSAVIPATMMKKIVITNRGRNVA